MNFLKNLFGGGGNAADKDGLYYYIQSDRTGEIIQVRIHRYNDLSVREGSDGYHVRKIVVGEKGFDRIEAYLTFDKKRQLVASEIDGGKLVDEATYYDYQAKHDAGTISP